MSACERCWGDAYRMSLDTGKDQSECYKILLEERKDNPCSARQQAGQFWDEKLQRDRRLPPETLPEKLAWLIRENPRSEWIIMSKDDAYHVLNDGANVHHISGKVTGVEKIGDTIVITIGTS